MKAVGAAAGNAVGAEDGATVVTDDEVMVVDEELTLDVVLLDEVALDVVLLDVVLLDVVLLLVVVVATQSIDRCSVFGWIKPEPHGLQMTSEVRVPSTSTLSFTPQYDHCRQVSELLAKE
jgi:hypothetical protein